MNSIPQISEAEWEVMRVVWKQSPLPAKQIIEHLAEPNGWSPKTVKALISRLVKKGALTYSVDGKAYLYSPAVSEHECVRMERKTFLNRVYNGALTPMLMHFMQDEKLSKEDIQKLKKMLEELE